MAKKSRIKKRQDLPLPKWLKFYIDDAKDWCQGRMWWPRLLFLFLMMHLMVCHIKDPMFQDIFKGLNLGIHEMGHMVFNPFGEFMTVAGGSLLQCLVPILSPLMFIRQRDYFGVAFCFAWLSTNLWDLAVYVDDSRKLQLPLVTPFKGDETIHDWNWMLDQLNMLQYDYVIANFMRGAAVVCMIIFLTAGSWLVYCMMDSKKNKADLSGEEAVG